MQSQKLDIQDLDIEGLKVIHLSPRRDERGAFTEVYREDLCMTGELSTRFVQFNRSQSKPGVLRGLHAQVNPPQMKYIQVLRGFIFDVVVDIRKTSPSFGRAVTLELRADRAEALWVPAGCLHGFAVMGDQEADVFYAVDAYHNPRGEIGLRWDDPTLAIRWPYQRPLLSAKDAAWPSFEELKEKIGRKEFL